MKKPLIITLHIGFWGCYTFLMFFILVAASQSQTTGLSIKYISKLILGFAIVPSIISFYSFYLFLFPKYFKYKKILQTIIYGLLFSIGSASIGAITLLILFDANFMHHNQYVSFFQEIVFITFIALISGIIALILKGFISWYDDIKKKAELIKKNSEMELALVKSKLDPHFLFNTINNIDVLIQKKPKDASNYLNNLSDIMRFMLFDTKTDVISLTKEIEYIEKYIELQKIRTSNSNYVNFTVIGTPNSINIAPMIFIPFIENAFKHVTNKKLENAIDIQILIEKSTISFTCKNKFNKNRKKHADNSYNGIGNELIKKRLNLIYPEKHNLELTNQDDVYQVVLTIKDV